MYTFTQTGVYVFVDSINTNSQTIISVISTSSSCPSGQTYSAATLQALSELGVALDTNVNEEVNWGFVAGLFTILMMLIFGMVGLIIYLHSKNLAGFGLGGDKEDSFKLCPCFRTKQLEEVKEEKKKHDLINAKDLKLLNEDLKSIIEKIRRRHENELDDEDDEEYRRMKQRLEDLKRECQRRLSAIE